MTCISNFTAAAVLGLAIAGTSIAADQKESTQTAGVDNTRMGAYRALAQLSFQAFKRGDLAMSAELARILERAWDAAEESGGPKSLEVKNNDLFEQIDTSMDDFIKPILHYATKTPPSRDVEAVYNAFLEKLKQGDQ
jgi:hypothetical protein